MKMNTKIFDYLPDVALKIRETVFMGEQGFPYELDEYDDRSWHFLIYENELPIGVCRVFRESDDSDYILGRVAVTKEYRRRKVGTQLIGDAEKLLAEKGIHKLLVHSQYDAKEFYAKIGYSYTDEIDWEDGVKHVWMEKEF